MKFHFLILLFSCLFLQQVHAQKDTTILDTTAARYSISLLTCGQGDELYSIFGHTAIRVKDNKAGTDFVYNYGIFNFADPDFYTKFTLGKLNYWVAADYYEDFLYAYKSENRTVKEQELKLSPAQAESVYHFLKENAKEENKYYKYDFVYDNCATRVRDVFTTALGPSFEYGTIMRLKKVSYRHALNQYMLEKHWVRLGVNIALGSRVDSIMTDHSSMFLPDFLFEGMKGAVLDGQAVVGKTQDIFTAKPGSDSVGMNTPFWISFILLMITLLVFFIPKLEKLKPVLSFVFLLFTGLLGCVLLFLWLFTAHQAFDNNWNILWAFPFNLIILFFMWKKSAFLKIYALAAISCLVVALLIHIIGFQFLPMMELLPFFGALLFVYMEMYRKGLEAAVLKWPKQEV